jgi:hypothetical protein
MRVIQKRLARFREVCCWTHVKGYAAEAILDLPWCREISKPVC